MVHSVHPYERTLRTNGAALSILSYPDAPCPAGDHVEGVSMTGARAERKE